MIKLYNKAMKVARNYNLWEISLFKIYLVAVSFIIAILFPIILKQNIYFYLITFIILDILCLIFLVKKEGNYFKKIFKKKKYKVFSKYNTFDFALFKITLVFFGLLVAKAFPVVLDINIGYYTLIMGFGMGYFIYGILKGK